LKPELGGRLEIDQFTVDWTGAAGTC
jgi:hypothetical protein